eukprot:2114385-Ditylum_brightwellii.AAC.1
MPSTVITARTSQASQLDLQVIDGINIRFLSNQQGQPIHSNGVNGFPQVTDGVNLGTTPIK